MTYNEFKRIMIDVYKGYDNIYIGETGPFTNSDAKTKMGHYLGFCPIEYCERILTDSYIIAMFEETA